MAKAKAQGTIRIQWVRSGIAFSYRAKEVIRSLGLRRLQQVVERPDTPQVRGLVAKVPHLVKIVQAQPPAPWTGVPEYVIGPVEVAAATARSTSEEAVADVETAEAEPVEASVAASKQAGKKKAAGPAKEPATRAKAAPQKRAKPHAEAKAKPAKAAAKKKPEKSAASEARGKRTEKGKK